MIISRLAHAIRNQNWSQIVTEIMIVIVGIFLGLQVQAWYEEQANRALEQDYLTRLLADFEVSHQELLTGRDTHVELVAEMDEIVAYLLAEKDDDALHQTLIARPWRMSYLIVPRIQTGTYQELVSTGRVTLLQNQSLRDSIQHYMEEVRRFNDGITFFREFNLFYETSLGAYNDVSLSASGEVQRVNNFKKFRGNSEATWLLSQGSEVHGSFVRRYDLMIEASTRTLNDFYCALRQPQCEVEVAP